MTVCNLAAQTTVSGIVDDGKEPLVGANVFIMGTIDGCLTDSLGRFAFQTDKTGEVTLRATYMGFEDCTLTTSQTTGLKLRMHERATDIEEVVVTASTYSFGKSDNFKTMDALDVVMAGNSCGDIVAALQSLPGTQKVGEDGKLYVRGGESEECQTFVNGMHVLVPYSTNVENNAVRGRFSPFLFKGINFSLGGYGGEYGQALSSVLPMETTDVATGDKLGISASLVDWNIGGTKAFAESSLSFNADYTSMGLYNAVSPDRCDWTRPYRKLSGEAQYKADLTPASILKTYVGYDMTSVGLNLTDRQLSLSEHNIYANATLKTHVGHGYSLFMGIANSSVINHIDDALVQGDHYRNIRNEVHLKCEARKVFSPVLKMSVGGEGYIRHSSKRYEPDHYHLNYHLLATHVDAQLRVVPRVFLHLSARAERMSIGDDWLLMPRTTLSYVPNRRFQLSATAGRYSQVAEDDFIAQSGERLGQSTADHGALLQEIPSSAPARQWCLHQRRSRHKPRTGHLLREPLAHQEPHDHGVVLVQ